LREAWVDVNNAGTGRMPLFFHSPSNFDTQVWFTPGQTFAFTIEGLTLRFAAESGDTPSPINLNYMRGIPALGATVQSNWLLAKYPSTYLFGSLSMAEAFIGDDERIGGWVQAREAAFNRIQTADRKARFTGGPLVIMPDIYGGGRPQQGSSTGDGTTTPPSGGDMRGPPITVNGSGPVGPSLDQAILVSNTILGPITLTLGAGAYIDQRVTIKDAAGNAGTYPITIAGPPGTLIDGNATLGIVFDYGSIDLMWLGSAWGTW